MYKWKDTAKTSHEVIKTTVKGKRIVFAKDSLVIIEKVLSDDLFLVLDANPNKNERRRYKLKSSEMIMEDYSISRDINIQMLLADGWDAQDLLRKN